MKDSLFCFVSIIVLGCVSSQQPGCDQFQEAACPLTEVNTLGTNVTSNPDLCQDLCIKAAGCNYFSYFYVNNMCYLHINCTEYFNCEDCVSGPPQPPFSSCYETTTGQIFCCIIVVAESAN